MIVRAVSRSRMRAALRSKVAALGATLAGAVVLLLAIGPAGAASASLGSVPAEVSSYVTGGGMLARLSDVYGPNGKGNAGIAFDATTKPGPISRVYEWTDARLAGQKTDHPVQLTNNWVVPISVGGRIIGLATIWINPQTVQPELADFAQDGALATALTTVPATAALVRDLPTHSWLALADGKVTPLVAGSSGLTTPAPVDSLTLTSTGVAPVTASAGPNTGLALAIGLVALIVVVILIALLVPRGRRAKEPALAGAPAMLAEPVAVEPVAVEPVAASKPAAVTTPVATSSAPKVPTVKPPTAQLPTAQAPASKTPTARPATPKPAGARPSGRTPTTSSAAKPATSKPPASRKPAASKPAASKPPAPKQPPRPRAPKPPASDSES